jgi:predicted secreted protein
MRQLGLIVLSLACLELGCKAAPEPSPAGASAPLPNPTSEGPPPAVTATEATTPPPPPPSAAPASDRTYAEGAKSISAKPGERFAVALPANVTIPMKWRIEPAPDAALLKLLEEKYFDEPPMGCDGCTGYGGTRVFSFEARGAGKTTLHFALKPLTNPAAKAEKEVSIEVTVGP